MSQAATPSLNVGNSVSDFAVVHRSYSRLDIATSSRDFCHLQLNLFQDLAEPFNSRQAADGGDIIPAEIIDPRHKDGQGETARLNCGIIREARTYDLTVETIESDIPPACEACRKISADMTDEQGTHKLLWHQAL